MVNKIVGIILNLLVVNLFSNTCVIDMRRRRRSWSTCDHTEYTAIESQWTRINDFNEIANSIANLGEEQSVKSGTARDSTEIHGIGRGSSN